MARYSVGLRVLLAIVLSLLVVGGMAGAQGTGVRYPVFAEFEEIGFEPGSIMTPGQNYVIFDGWTVLAYSGDWDGISPGLCNVFLHDRNSNGLIGTFTCHVEFEGTILGREGTVNHTVTGFIHENGVTTGQYALHGGTRQLADITGHITFEQTGAFGTIQGYVVFPSD